MKKRIAWRSLCLAGALMLSACASSPKTETTKEETAEVTTSAEETKKSDTDAKIESVEEESTSDLEKTSNDAPADTTEQSDIEATAQSTEAIVFEEANYEAYASNDVNVRTSPEVSEGNLYKTIGKNTAFVVTGVSGDWCRIQYEDGVYYVAAAYVTEGTVSVPQTQTNANGTTLTIPNENYNGIIVAVDAGHQQHGISEQEPNAPGSSVMKAKLTTGTQGISTGAVEYELNLQVSLKLKQALLDRGYGVFMIRENNDCPMSNAERAVAANESGASIFIRVHANSSDNTDISGCLTMAPSAENAYVGYLAEDSQRLSALVTDAICATTGAQNRGVQSTDTMTGINWCTIPVTIVEMGFMSNPTEDQLMAQDYYRQEVAYGIANAVDQYFGKTAGL